jgi:DNA-binding NtrC family response regulator
VAKFDFEGEGTAASAQAVTSASTLAERFSLTVERGSNVGATFELDGTAPQAVIVGQSPLCPLRLTDPTVSRRHAALEVVDGLLRVRDLGSRNGTYVGGVRVVDGFARVGDGITLGETLLRVRAAPAPADPLRVGDGPVERPGDRFGEAIGVSLEMRRLFPLLRRLAATTIPVLIEGETGTGKEAVAQSLHDEGPRAHKPFVVLDCTAVSASLVESELFGHEKGAFTGATSRRRGVFEQAHGGTLFIDELGDLPLDLQAKLLRALETGKVRRVGGESFIACDARVIAATRRDLEQRVVDGHFRDDLFHRLAVGRVALPPLRDRQGDIPRLVEHFAALLGVDARTFPADLLASWTREAWPGNVRELRNAVTRHVSLGDLAREHVRAPPETAPDDSAGAELERILAALAPHEEAREVVLALFNRHYCDRLVAAHGGNVQRAAEASGLALRYFQLLRARGRKAGGT